VKLIVIANLLISMRTPTKTAEFHSTIIPPDAPTEGEYAKLS
jgi:hypothetical protein